MKLKSLFSTPKKAILTSVCVAAVLAVTGTATVFTAEGIAKSSSIGTTAAEEKALSDAGVNKEDAAFSVTEFEFQKGRFVYDVEFTAGGIEYDYVIKASDGTVLSRKAKVDDDDLQQVTAAPDNTAPTTLADEYISLDAAKTKALDDAGLNASDVNSMVYPYMTSNSIRRTQNTITKSMPKPALSMKEVWTGRRATHRLRMNRAISVLTPLKAKRWTMRD